MVRPMQKVVPDGDSDENYISSDGGVCTVLTLATNAMAQDQQPW